jgi:hypothetical protein
MKWTNKWLQELKEKRKIKEQEELIKALKRPEDQSRRRPAAKFAANRTTGTGPG